MYDKLIELAVDLVVAFFVGALIYNWVNIANKVAEWLRENKLEKSELMSVLIVFDKIISNVKCKLTVLTNQMEKIIEEKNITLDQLKKEDPELYDILQTRSSASKDVTIKVLSQLS